MAAGTDNKRSLITLFANGVSTWHVMPPGQRRLEGSSHIAELCTGGRRGEQKKKEGVGFDSTLKLRADLQNSDKSGCYNY